MVALTVVREISVNDINAFDIHLARSYVGVLLKATMGRSGTSVLCIFGSQ